MFNYFKKSFLIFLCIGILPSAYAMGTTTFASILSPFSYLYNKLHKYNYTLQGSFSRIFETGKFTPENIEIIQKYLDKSHSPNIRIGKNEKTPLILAVEHQNLDMIKLLLNYNADINASDLWGNTPLSTAVKTGNLQVAEYLLQHKADQSVKNDTFPLKIAVAYQNLDMIKLLFKYNADVNASDYWGNTPLSTAVKTGNLQVAEYLLQHKADQSVKNDTFPLKIAVEYQNLDMIKLLFKYNADVNASDYWGNTPLSAAVDRENQEIATYLLERGANPNTKERVPLILAVQYKNLDMIKLLLQNKADINHVDINGLTPLFIAIDGFKLKAIKLLCNAGASLINVEIRFNSSAFHAAIYRTFDINKVKKLIETLITYTRFDELPRVALEMLLILRKRYPETCKDSHNLILSTLALLAPNNAGNLDDFKKKMGEELSIITTYRDPLLAQVYKRILRLKEILQIKNDQNETALDLLHISFNADRYPDDLELIKELEQLLDGTRLDDDFKKLEIVLTEIKSGASELNQPELTSILNSKLPNNLALEIYKNCACLEHEKN